MAEKTDFLAGLVIGTLVGIGLGMLFAPEPGQKMRERLRGKADEVGDRLRGSTEDITDRLRGTMDEVGGRMRTAYERGRETVEQKRDDILERLQDSD